MMKRFILSSILFIALCAKAQEVPPDLDSARFALHASGSFLMQSSTLTSEFGKKFFVQPGVITDEMKTLSAEKLKQSNQFGLRLGGSISYYHQLKKQGLYLNIQAAQYEFVNANFNSDFYDLALNGNKQFEDDNADLGGFDLNNLRFQKYGIGLYWTALDTVAKLSFNLSYVNGIRQLSLDVERASLFTETLGEAIHLDTKFNYLRSDTNATGLFANAGNGAAADIYFEAPFQLKKRTGKFHIAVNNMGFINWNDNAVQYKVDSNFTFNGFEVKNIFDVSDSLFSNLDVDSVTNALLNKGEGTRSTTMPASLLLYTRTDYGKFKLVKGIYHLFAANYKLRYFINGEYAFNENLTACLGMSYGGYGGFSGNLGIDLRIGKSFDLYLRSNNVEGWLMPKSTYGQSIYVGLTKRFY